MQTWFRIGALAGVLGAGSALAQGDRTAELTVIHGISDLPAPVDVFVDGAFQFSFEFTDIVGGIELPGGTYELEVRLLGDPVLSATATLEAGGNFTAIAHETFIEGPASGIALALFENDASTVRGPLGRLTARHTADAPEVDITLSIGDTTVVGLEGLSNPQGGSPTQAGPISAVSLPFDVTFFPAGGADGVFAVPGVQPTPAVSTIAYAVGSLPRGTFTVLLQTIETGEDGVAVFGDLNGDGVVDIADLDVLISLFGTSDRTGDLDGDGIVTIFDAIILIELIVGRG